MFGDVFYRYYKLVMCFSTNGKQGVGSQIGLVCHNHTNLLSWCGYGTPIRPHSLVHFISEFDV